MGILFPSLDNINRLNVSPTEGEYFLLNYLEKNLPDDYEVFFQPFLDGDMPDIIIMRHGGGVIIIEVKDWRLSSYYIDNNNKWYVKNNDEIIKSPFQQVFGYKKNMFNLHINGLAEKKVMNPNFFSVIKPFVYFHGAEKKDIDDIYYQAEILIKESKNNLNKNFNNMEYEKYEKKRIFLENKSKQIKRDKNLSQYDKNLKKILKCLDEDHILFSTDIYNEFKRYLSPPYHTLKEGIEINYSKKQKRLIESYPELKKIKGVAGSGKTIILAKRAVNSHIRHNGKVLIVTYNKTLRNYIKDSINKVREDFSWGEFGITTYHSFISQQLNSCGIDITPPDDGQDVSEYFSQLYLNTNLFDGYESKIYKYKTILIDEVQDYEPSWIIILKKYFLSQAGEMILFGDDSQNIYKRNISKKNSFIVKGFGRWERLNKSYRSKNNSKITSIAKEYQKKYLMDKYDTDLVVTEPSQGVLSFDITKGYIFNDHNDCNKIINTIYIHIKKEKIHPNDLCIVSTDISLLRKIDKIIRLEINEKTITTFETEDEYIKLKEKHKNNKYKLKKDLEEIRSGKKYSFYLNSGKVKISTVHSFKGLESPTIIYLLKNDDNNEMVYTGITRGKHNFIVFLQKGAKYMDFFESEINIEKIACF